MQLFKKILKWALIVLVAIFVFVSVFPYLIPIHEGESFMARRDYFPNSQIDEFDGIWVHYRVFEPIGATKGNFLLIHGFSGSTFSWRKNVEFLQNKGFRVLCVDLPAFGYSDRLPTWNHSVENRANLLWKIAEKIDNEGSWLIAGHSMGAGVALAMGQMKPEKTQKIFCIDGLFAQRKNTNLGSLLLAYPPLQRWAEVVLQKHYTKKVNFKELLKSAYAQEPTDEDVEGYLAPMLVRGTATAILSSFNANSDFEMNYSALQEKIVVVWGTADRWIPLSSAQNWHQKYPQIPLETIEAAGHCPMETHTQAFHLILDKYLSK